MNPEILYIKKFKGLGEWEYKDSGVFYCGQCRLVYPNLERANQCCQNYLCKCGKRCERKYYLSCDECTKKQEIAREKEKFNKSTKLDIKDYKGYLLSDETANDDFSMYFDDYFENTCQFGCPVCGEETTPVSNKQDERSHLICKNSECLWVSPEYEVIDEIYYLFAPEYIWAADFEPLELDLGNILEHATEEHHETVNDYMKGTEELKIAIDKFNELNKGIGSYQDSNTLALINIKDYVKELYNK
jgi:uncharacterized protein YbaR (Trm112 family)